MIIQMPVEKKSGLGIITTGDIESEIRRRGIYVEAVVVSPVIEPLPETPIFEPWLPITLPGVEPLPEPPIPDILPWPETPIVVLPGEEGISPIVEPWLPVFPLLEEPEITELYTPPYPEEELLPLTPTDVPEPEAPSKVPLLIGVAVLAWASLGNGKKGKKRKKGKPNEGG